MGGAPTATSPVQEALRHAAELVELLGCSEVVDAEAVALARPDWPPWPQAGLDLLVGPPGAHVKRLDLRWLHRFEATVGVLDQLVRGRGGPAGGPSAVSLLTERAAMLGHRGWGTWSAGNSCRLVRAGDGWLAINLPREDDLEAVPAWLEVAPTPDAWESIAEHVAHRGTARLLEQAHLLGLAVAEVPQPGGPVSTHAAIRICHSAPATFRAQPLVVDLTSLWAGPLCGWYLARAGARVVKVEANRRPDGGHAFPEFYDRLNHSKELRRLDLADAHGQAELADLINQADVVIEASRPRALQAMGIDAAAEVARGKIWCSITGHGRAMPGGGWVAFGDDAAAAAGLVTFVHAQPWFIGDAAADPITGATAAAAVLGLLTTGKAALVDAAMVQSVRALTDGQPVASHVG